MEYISAEEFLKQPVEVQNVFLEWWKPQIDSYDIVQHIITEEISLAGYYQDFYESGFVPLLTEGQLRKFIEDKKGYKLEISYYSSGYEFYTVDKGLGFYERFAVLGHNMLQAYWKVAIEIAKGEADENRRS
ncbi:hypothetical protein FC961_14560 [Clostridium botulinum]|nr:hypothetical protein [Clostridium botulinum]NFO92478.1 hypothetical protein [Clostridium botulinum]